MPTPLPRAPADPNDPRNAPPATLGSPVRNAVAAATFAAYEIAGLPQPGERYEDYLQRIGAITLCDQTRGQVVRTPDGRDVQLAPDECVTGDVIAEPGPDGRGGGHFLAVEKDGKLGVIDRDGTVRASDRRAVPMATPTDRKITARRQRVIDDGRRALAELERVTVPLTP